MTLVRRDLLSGIDWILRRQARRLVGPQGPCPPVRRAAAVLPGSGGSRRALGGQAFEPADGTLPEVLTELDYDKHRAIYSAPTRRCGMASVWMPRCNSFHLGYHFKTPVHIYEVADGMARQMLYTPELFDFGQNGFKPDFARGPWLRRLPAARPLNRPDYLDELAVFLGASYFRALGRNQRYGISARGVAIDTGLPKQEEFPAFRRFWLERPAPGADQVAMHALLDGPSLTGVHFRMRPGDATVMDVEATLYPRQAIELLGIAPLTSMFLFGSNDRQGVDDFRPQVHDSEGLQIWSGSGEWFWRPLVNPEQLRLSLFGDKDPKGFGLMQRTRAFEV